MFSRIRSSSKNCTKRRKCNVCKGGHPRSLHGFQLQQKDKKSEKESEEKEPLKSNSTGVNCAEAKFNQVISMCVVPVHIRHKKSNIVVRTLAMLDNCSQGSFVKTELLEKLEVEGTNTSVTIKTLNGNQKHSSVAVDGLEVSNVEESLGNWIKLPKMFSQDDLPVAANEIATPDNIKQWKYLHRIIPEMKIDKVLEVELLIGANCLRALEPQEVISSQYDGPYAFKTRLGWCIVGPITEGYQDRRFHCNKIAVEDTSTGNISKHDFEIEKSIKENGISDLLKKLYNADFTESKTTLTNGINENLTEVSTEDIAFLKLMDSKCSRSGDHYELPLPFRDEDINLPNNKMLAEKRLQYLKKKFQKDEKFQSDYKAFMKTIFEKGYAREAQPDNQNNNSWYIPHHGVYHPRKLDKLRVVFDCSSEFKGRSLNKELMSGPDLTNQIVGLLARFRKNKVAFMADIESMFYQVLVAEEHRSYLKFLWWKDGNYKNPVTDCEMNVHVFGATSSPGCSNYALKKTSVEYKEQYGEEASKTLRRNFYVDDLLKSVRTEEEAIHLVKNVKMMCKSGGFNLTKFLCNSKVVLDTIPACDRRKSVAEFNFMNQSLPADAALGVLWNVDQDVFTFNVKLKDKAMSRRGMLSTLSSIYDTLGFAAPFILQGRKILQKLCEEKINWDDEVNQKFKDSLENWKHCIKQLESVKINRCFMNCNYQKITHCSLHHFTDASESGYDVVTYIRTVNEEGKIYCNLVMAKSRVAPLKFVSIPRLELTAAAIGTKIAKQLKDELDIKIHEERFWTDSKVVLAYIKNTKKRFKVFVANHLHQIRTSSDVTQW